MKWFVPLMVVATFSFAPSNADDLPRVSEQDIKGLIETCIADADADPSDASHIENSCLLVLVEICGLDSSIAKLDSSKADDESCSELLVQTFTTKTDALISELEQILAQNEKNRVPFTSTRKKGLERLKNPESFADHPCSEEHTDQQCVAIRSGLAWSEARALKRISLKSASKH